MPQSYRIADEPARGPLSRYVVDPMFCLLASMLGGGFVGMPWFSFNALAMGSATRKKEMIAAGLYPALSVVICFLLFEAVRVLGFVPEGLPKRAQIYAAIAVSGVKVAILYFIQMRQSRSFAVFSYYEKAAAFGPFVVGAAAVSRGVVLDWAFDVSFWLGVAVV